jgi:tetratricopeptide (TPR) repeat protein
MVYPLAPLFGQLLCGELRRSGVDFSVAMLPSAPAIARHLRPAVAAVRRTPAGIEVTSQGSPPGGGAAALVPMAVAIAGFRVSHASVAVGRAQATAENRLGEAAAQRGQADEAIHHFRRALAMAPASAETHADLGKALLSRGQIDEAIAHFRKALELQPDNAEARKSLENALRQREQPGTAK